MTPPRSLLMLLPVLALVHALPCAAEADSDLGRLFNTPQHRAILDEMRARNMQISPRQQTDVIRLDGIVRRSDGHNTVWLNGEAYQDHAPVIRLEDSAATLPTGKDRYTRLKVGDTLTIKPRGARPTAP